MRRATRPSPIVASTKANPMRPVPVGSANPSVVSDEALISKARDQVRWAVPQKTQVNASIIRIIQASGRVTRATGAYSPRSDLVAASLRRRCTNSR